MKLARVPIILLVLLLGLSVAPRIVLAEDSSTETDTHSQEQATEAAKKLEEARKEAAEKRAEQAKQDQEKETEADKKAGEVFQKACENRREAFKTRLGNLSEHSQKVVEVMDKIVDRVEAFKTSKNLDVPNYDALVADVNAKKAVVHNLQNVAKADSDQDFNCDRSHALERVQSFTDILHQQIDALKDYKTAIKNLIVAVKTAAGKQTTTTGGTSNESQQ